MVHFHLGSQVAAVQDSARGLREHIWPQIETGKIRPVIHATFPLEQAAEAHRLMERGEQIGKIMLTVDHAVA